ncbi:MAG: hypothetical protein AAB442_03000 [Patescibacteria group bacterium]
MAILHSVADVLNDPHFSPAETSFVLVGEMHGSRQNATIIREIASVLLRHSRPLTIAFEWTLEKTELEELREYTRGGSLPRKLPNFFLCSDGRFTYEHAVLLKWIRTYNLQKGLAIDIHAFDRGGNNASDEDMAHSLLLYKEKHPHSIILVETGNVHARNSKYFFENIEKEPLGSILKRRDTAFSIFCAYKEGYVNVEGVSRDVTQAESQVEGRGTYFDAVINIPVSVAAEEIESLTSVSELLKSKTAISPAP